jgi:hydrogenase-4 component D
MLVLLALAVMLPMTGALLALIFKRRLSTWLAVLFSVATAVVSLTAALKIFPDRYEKLFGSMPWIKDLTMPSLFGVRIDPLASLMLGLVTVIGAVVTIYSTEYMSPRNKYHPIKGDNRAYFFWLLVFIGSMTGVALSPNLLQLLIFWELTTLCSWVLISHTKTEAALRAGFRALIMTSVGTAFFMTGLVVLFIFTRSFEFGALSRLAPGMRSFVFLLFLVAAWAKAAQIPFHTWLPQAMEAPSPVSAYLHAAAMVKVGAYAIARITMESTGISETLAILMAVMAFATITMALLCYFLQDDLKKLLAYSTIAHLGYIFLGIFLGMLGSELAFRGAILHILMHGTAKATLFLAVGGVVYATGTRKISELRGLGDRLPIEKWAFFIGVLAVTGVPPFACFWSKYFIFQGAVQTHSAAGPILMVLAVTESAVTFGWLMYVWHRVFLAPPPKPSEAEGKEAPERELAVADPPAIHWVLVGLTILCLVIPWIGIPIVQQISLHP